MGNRTESLQIQRGAHGGYDLVHVSSGRVVLSAPTTDPLTDYMRGWQDARDELEATGADSLREALEETA